MFFHKIPLSGKLPGDIHVNTVHTEFYFPIVTGLVQSLLPGGMLRFPIPPDKK
jgi:hypothetical protein